MFYIIFYRKTVERHKTVRNSEKGFLYFGIMTRLIAKGDYKGGMILI